MSLAVEVLRPYWLSGIHDVTGTPGKGVKGWITGERYQVYSPLLQDTAELSFAVSSAPTAALAADANRMAAASIETVEGIAVDTNLPKSLAWPLIRAYYAGFFAGHALLRIFGRTCTQLESGHLSSIHTVSDLFGNRSGISLTRGQYSGIVDRSGSKIIFQRLKGGDGGSHAAMWGMLVELLRDLSGQILAGPTPRSSPLIPVNATRRRL